MGGVTPHGIRYPDGASKAKNLGPELKTMAEDIDWYIGSYLSPTGPIRQIIIGVAEEVVPPIVQRELDDANVVRAYPETGDIGYTSEPSVPMQWVHRAVADPYGDTYGDTYTGSWAGSTKRRGDVPVLSANGLIRPHQIPDSYLQSDDIARMIADAVAAIPIPEAPHVDNGVWDRPSNWWARIIRQRRLGEPSAAVFAGSSTTANDPGYVAALTPRIQAALYPEGTPTAPQWSQTADFIAETGAGLHVYNAGQPGTTTADYLTSGEVSQIAALSPALMFHMIGSNDYVTQMNPDTYRSNILARLAWFDAALTDPCQHVLVHAYAHRTFTPSNYPHSAYGDVLRDLADSRPDVAFLDLSRAYRDAEVPGADPLHLIGSDNTHQTVDGYAFMSELVYKFLTT